MCVCGWVGGCDRSQDSIQAGCLDLMATLGNSQGAEYLKTSLKQLISQSGTIIGLDTIWTLRNSKEPTFTQKLITNKTSSCSFWQQETKKSDKPKPPPPSIVLPVEVMKQMIQKALDHTQRLNKGTFVWQPLAYCIMLIAKGPGQLSIRRRN